jgi:hypothetical protein
MLDLERSVATEPPPRPQPAAAGAPGEDVPRRS